MQILNHKISARELDKKNTENSIAVNPSKSQSAQTTQPVKSTYLALAVFGLSAVTRVQAAEVEMSYPPLPPEGNPDKKWRLELLKREVHLAGAGYSFSPHGDSKTTPETVEYNLSEKDCQKLSNFKNEMVNKEIGVGGVYGVNAPKDEFICYNLEENTILETRSKLN